MKIRLLSDLHRESGPWTWTDQGEGVVVLAGDIDNGVVGVEWAKTIPKPVIMVAGNHDHWGQPDFHENLKAMRKAAKGSNVHFLERDSVIITVGDESVRFLGCSLWTDYCRGSNNMICAAVNGVRDYRLIKAAAWNARNQKRIAAFEKRFGYRQWTGHEDKLHPLMLMDINKLSLKWLKNEFENGSSDDIPTIVVTHHAPSMQSLVRARMIDETAIGHHDHIRFKEDAAIRMAAYASDLEWLLDRHKSRIAAWFHGHVHEPLDYALHNIRVVCNPRGYHEKPLTLESASAMALFGYSPSPDTIKRDQEDFAENPERGTVQGFEQEKLIDLADGIVPCLVPQAMKIAEEFLPLIDELRTLASNEYLNEPGMRSIMCRATVNIIDDVNEVLARIAKENDFSKELVGHRFPQSIYFTDTHLAGGHVEIPMPELVEELIERAVERYQFFAGDGYGKHVAKARGRFYKSWLWKEVSAE